MNMFSSQTMGTSIKYMLCLSMLIIKLGLIHGYDSQTIVMKIDNLDKQLKTVIKELHEEKEKSVNLEKQLSALKDESKGTPCNYKDQKKEVETVPTYSKCVTTLLIHDAMIVSLNESLVDIEASLVELNDNCLDKGWSVWSNWSKCGKSCGIGLKTSTRTCGSTNTLLSGKCCIGTDTKIQVCTLPSCPDLLPTANAGDDQTVQSPDDRIVLSGRRSTDDVGIVKYEWSQTSGPKADIRELDSPDIELYNLEPGTFTIQIKVTDALGQTDTDDVVITVLPEPDEPPIANAGPDQTVQLPMDTAKLFGNRSTDDQGIVEYRWSVSSTTGRDPRMQDSNKAILGLSNLEEGDYVLTLTVKDKLGQSSSDSARVRVSSEESSDSKDCLEVLNKNKNHVNGVYEVRSPSSGLVYPVYCDMTTDEGRWTIFQKRFDGSLDFYRTFKEYEDGFGDVNAEFWMGLKRIHEMTAKHNTELRIHLTAADGSTAYATFQNFSVSPGPDYKLYIGQAAGTAGDVLTTWNNGMRFSTNDKDVDGSSGRDCAELCHGGWWYNSCSLVNLNGDYATPGTESSYKYGLGGVIYYSFKKLESLKTTTMMFRRK